jgi:chemotaxis protein MotB
MSTSTRGGRRRRGGAAAEQENEERWLLTYADMITLLMALFMVLFSMSVVNKAKMESLAQSLQEAFSGKIMPGGKSIQHSGATDNVDQSPPEPPIPAIQPVVQAEAKKREQEQKKVEDEQLRKLKQQVDSYAKAHNLESKLVTTIAQRGLVIRLLTDKVVFDSGRAELKPQAEPVLRQVAKLIRTDPSHPVMVEGHTDSVPIRGAQFPTNWELSTARASRVVRTLIEGGVGRRRLGAAGYAWLHPIASNATAAGRSRNRRVDIVLLRKNRAAAGGGELP